MEKEWKKGTETNYIVRTCGWSPPGDHPVGCGMKLHIKDGRLVKVEGDPEHPISQGRLCIRCLTLPEYVHHPQRITSPMKRDKADRGKDKWTKISWDEAYDIIEEKVKEIKGKWGPESIMVYGGTGREATLYYPALAFAVLQTPNCTCPLSGSACYGPRCTVTDFVMGAGYPEIDYAGFFPDRYDHPGYQVPEYIMIWGKAPLESNADGFYGHAIIDLMKRGSKLIVVDPRATWLATKAEYHLQLRPGTDAALALGILNVLINENLYDHDFVEKWCHGFDELSKRVQEYPPDKVAEITWISKEKIIAAARAFGKAGNSAVQWGVATVQARNGMQTCQSLCDIMAITGNLDVPGGITIGKPSSTLGQWRYSTCRGEVDPELFAKRIGTKEWPASAASMLICQPDECLDTLETGKPYPLKMAWINSTNLYACINATPERWYRALLKMEFTVIQELFMTPSAMALADIFLPMSTFPEHDGVVLPHFGRNTNMICAMNKAMEVGDCRSDLEICIELGKRLNPDAWPWNSAAEFFSEQFKTTVGTDFDGLRETGVFQPEYIYKKYEKGLLRADGEPGFETMTGKVELTSAILEVWGEDPLPYYEEPPYSPYSTPDLCKEYPLILTTGARTYSYFHSEQRQIPTLREITPDPIMEIHPETAAKLGIIEGDWVWMENMFGKARQKAHLTETIHPKVVHGVHAWWYPEQEIAEPNLGGVWKSNINMLVPHKHIGRLGQAAPYKSLICKVYKADNFER